MSVRFRLVNMLETSVRKLFPTACQKNRTRRGPPWKREPYTASARPSLMGASRRGSSAGSYSRSASWATITLPVAAAIPVLSAAPLPRFVGWWSTRCTSPEPGDPPSRHAGQVEVLEMTEAEPSRLELLRQLRGDVPAEVSQRFVEGAVQRSQRRHQEDEPSAGLEQVVHRTQRRAVVLDVLQDVQADDGIEPLGAESGAHRGQPQLRDRHVRPPCEPLAQPVKVVALGVGEHDPLAVDQERRHVADSGPDLEHPAPHPGAQPVEHPAIVAGGRGHALERRGPDLIRRLRRGGHRLRSGSAYDTG